VNAVAAQPLLLVDVDGVLNPLAATQPSASYQRHQLLGYELWLTREHGTWLDELATVFELTWATAWEHDANRLIAPAIGLADPLPVIEFHEGRMAAEGIWKRPAVERATAGRPFAWADDDFGPSDLAWAQRRTAAGAPALLLACDPLVGLTRGHVEVALSWAAQLRDGDGHQVLPVA
jgi:hypothetical protein